MKLEDVTKILESIQPELQKIEDPHVKHVVSVLLNLIEMLASDNEVDPCVKTKKSRV